MKFREKHRKNYLDRVKFYCDNHVDIDQYEHHLEEKSDRFVKESKSNLLDVLGCLIIALIVILIVTVPMIATGLTIKLFGGIDKYNEYKNTLVTEDVNISTVSYTEDVLGNPQAVVNFNQIFDFNTISDNSLYDKSSELGTINILTTTAFETWSGAYVSLIGGHSYYCYVESDCNCFIELYSSVVSVQKNLINTQIYIPPTTNDQYKVYVRRFTNDSMPIGYLRFYMIDLNVMFGDNLPSLDDCQQLFIADFYPYNLGETMSFGGLNAYADGYNDAVAITEYMPTASSFINALQDVDSYGLYGSIQRGTSGITITTNNTNKDLAAYYPFNFVVPIGTKVKIVARAGHNNGNFSTPIQFAYFDSVGNKQVITSHNITTNSGFNVSFESPVPLSGLYIIVPSDESTSYQVTIWNIEISMLVSNAIAGIQTAYDQGYDNGFSIASRNYQVGGSGYNTIYNAGKAAGIEASGQYTFFSLFSSVIEAPLGAVLSMFNFEFLGVNLKNAVTLIFTLCVLMAIIRLFYGG